MKTAAKRLLATVAAVSTIFGMSTVPVFATEGNSTSSGNAVNISDANATAEARALFAKLKNSGKGDLRFGQQHATDEHISSTASQGDVYEMTGRYPAVFGWDAGLALRGAEKPGSGSDKQANATTLANNIAEADAKGAIVTLSAHWYNPGTGGDFNDTTAVASELLPGGKYSGTFNEELDAIAATAQQAKRSDGTLIPIIFRPLHENNGSWFWWGATHASASEYKELYRYIVNYLRDIKGVHNLLYAYSPGGVFNGDSTDYLSTYPGDQWVDVLGYDEYDTDNSADDSSAWIATVVKDMKMISALASKSGKIVALTEFGRSGDRKYTGEGDKDLDFFSELADALAKEVPNTAYMMTWANFGGSGDGFQAYTPWKGANGEQEFKNFADSNANLMASAANVDYSNALEAAARSGSVRIVTPTSGQYVSNTKLTIRMKADDVRYSALDLDSAKVVTDRGVTVPMSYSCNGYFMGTLNLDEAGIALDQSKLTLTPQLKTKDGKSVAFADGDGSVTVKLGAKPEKTVDDVESFDEYASDEELQSTYSPNHSIKANFTLTDSPKSDGGKAGNLHYDFESYPDYNGFQRSFTPKQDWSGFSKMTFDLKADGSDHKFVVQLNAGGVTFEAYPSIAGTDNHTVTLNFGDSDGNGGDFAPASWDSEHAGVTLSQKLLSKVGSFALYVNSNGGNRPKTGDLVIDSIKLDGKRDAYVSPAKPDVVPADPKTVDGFSTYEDDDSLQKAWANRGHTEVLSLADGPTEGSKAMNFKHDFANGGWYDVAQYLGGANWNGEGTLTLQVRGDGSNNAIGLQIGTSEGKYFQHDIKLDFEGWKSVEIPLIDNAELVQIWPQDANQNKPMTDDDLASIKELVFASNQWNSESNGIEFAIADIKVTPASDATTAGDSTDADGSQAETVVPDVQAGTNDVNEAVADTSADVANQDPATCQISNDSTKDDPTKEDSTKDSPKEDPSKKNSKPDKLSNTGSNVRSAIAVAAVLLLSGCAVLIARKRKEA
ncbi:glycosyl hydrolase [Bifidobacterium catenulatum]|uniref:glycosyl hydrolase n=1 Tax=Bifidobacterium catenulatum TaxID=1686 RepID=UPI003D2F37E0